MQTFMSKWNAGRAMLLACAAALPLATPAMAQGNVDGDTILVTALKRAQDVQDVPISMAVMDGDQLSNLDVQDFNQLDRFVPNFFVQTTPGSNAFYIRGIGSSPGNQSGEQTVGLFVDGIYGGRARQFQAPFLDVERIEVLRGPQGALVGKNTSAGAISITSARPTRELEAAADLSYRFDPTSGVRAYGMVSGPVNDVISVRLAGQYENYSGFIENATLGGKEPKRETYYGRASVLIDSDGPADLLLKVEGGKVKLTGNSVERFLTPDDPDRIRDTGGFPGFLDKDWDDTENLSAAAIANLYLGDHTLNSITGFSHYNFQKRIDADFSPAPLTAAGFTEDYDQMSQELRIISPETGGLEYIFGGYFHISDFTQTGTTVLNVGPYNGSTDRYFRQKNTVWSGYGSATYHITPELLVMGSLRYTYDRKTANQTRATAGVVLPTYLDTPLSGKRTEKNWDPSASIQWKPVPEAMFYVSYGEGSKAGGFVGAQAVTLPENFELEPESSKTYEVGTKLVLFDRRLRLNIAAFRTDFKNLQVGSYDTVTASFIISNAGTSRSQGVEGDFQFTVTDGVTLSGSFAYLDAKYRDFLGAQCLWTNPTCDPSTNNIGGLAMQRSPKWSGTLTADAKLPLNDYINFLGNAGVTYRSSAIMEESYNPAGNQPKYAKVDMRVGIGQADGLWELAVVGKNLTNKLTAAHAFDTPFAAPGTIAKFLEEPRTIAVQAKFRY